MNFIPMAAKKDAADKHRASSPAARNVSRRGGKAFDLWLQRGLHQLFDEVANEPIPEELLRLIEDDRDSTK